MKNVILILLVLLLCSCSYQPLYKQYNYASISSSSLFVIDGEVYNLFSGDLPFISTIQTHIQSLLTQQ